MIRAGLVCVEVAVVLISLVLGLVGPGVLPILRSGSPLPEIDSPAEIPDESDPITFEMPISEPVTVLRNGVTTPETPTPAPPPTVEQITAPARPVAVVSCPGGVCPMPTASAPVASTPPPVVASSVPAQASLVPQAIPMRSAVVGSSCPGGVCGIRLPAPALAPARPVYSYPPAASCPGGQCQVRQQPGFRLFRR